MTPLTDTCSFWRVRQLGGNLKINMRGLIGPVGTFKIVFEIDRWIRYRKAISVPDRLD